MYSEPGFATSFDKKFSKNFSGLRLRTPAKRTQPVSRPWRLHITRPRCCFQHRGLAKNFSFRVSWSLRSGWVRYTVPFPDRRCSSRPPPARPASSRCPGGRCGRSRSRDALLHAPRPPACPLQWQTSHSVYLHNMRDKAHRINDPPFNGVHTCEPAVLRVIHPRLGVVHSQHVVILVPCVGDFGQIREMPNKFCSQPSRRAIADSTALQAPFKLL